MQSGTKVLVFASQKGGSGKTTLSGHIAIKAEMAGDGPVAVIDTDPQRSLAQWRYAREDTALVLKVSDVDNIADDIAELKQLGIKTIVVDIPPNGYLIWIEGWSFRTKFRHIVAAGKRQTTEIKAETGGARDNIEKMRRLFDAIEEFVKTHRPAG